MNYLIAGGIVCFVFGVMGLPFYANNPTLWENWIPSLYSFVASYILIIMGLRCIELSKDSVERKTKKGLSR